MVNIYLIGSIVCFLFGYIYEKFSHDVFSPFMVSSFVIPLILGIVPYSILSFKKQKLELNKYAEKSYNYGVLTLTIGCILKGVLEIYGTTNSLIYVYLIFGLLLIGGGIVFLK